jgi:hypothetical protein
VTARDLEKKVDAILKNNPSLTRKVSKTAIRDKLHKRAESRLKAPKPVTLDGIFGDAKGSPARSMEKRNKESALPLNHDPNAPAKFVYWGG